jgi:hypothetical protein
MVQGGAHLKDEHINLRTFALRLRNRITMRSILSAEYTPAMCAIEVSEATFG